AVLLYISGLSMNRTAKLLGVSTPSVQAWIEQFAQAYGQKPEPEGRAWSSSWTRCGIISKKLERQSWLAKELLEAAEIGLGISAELRP
ncbi:MAG TPA: helix-turn-helix domain-containing protein, partial [Geminicoccaceae bacterium]|nr:helix-turn-helix domain-containing protein [Geminicoccaceae bacterium]